MKKLKLRLKVKDDPIENNLFIISIDKSISKDKTIIVYANDYTIDEFGNVIFKNGKEKIFTITTGNWESITKYDDNIPEIDQPVRYQTLKQHFEELELAIMELEETERKAAEAEAAEEAKVALERSIKMEELAKSIKE